MRTNEMEMVCVVRIMWRKKLIKVMANGNLCCITSLELNDIRINSGNSPEMFMHIHV